MCAYLISASLRLIDVKNTGRVSCIKHEPKPNFEASVSITMLLVSNIFMVGALVILFLNLFKHSL